MISLDGSSGEGGGQIVRSALALSMVTGKAFSIEGVRARRAKPGLMRQHLAAVEASARLSRARVEGAAVGSRRLVFEPASVVPGHYEFAIGSAGSATLVLQTVLPALLTASGPSSLSVSGGTHNPLAPPFDFLQRSFLPLVASMGPVLEARLERAGFYPAGGGSLSVQIKPVERLSTLELLERGAIRSQRARALVARLPPSIGERELRVVGERLGWDRSCLEVETLRDAPGPGNVLLLEIDCERVTFVAAGFGERGVRAEEVAARAVSQAERWLASRLPVDEHLADQLLVPMAIAGAGAFRTGPLSLHARTQIDLIGRFLDVPIRAEQAGEVVEVRVGA